MDAAAEDEAERQRSRARLYAPPKGMKAAGGRRVRPPGTGMGLAQARALAAQVAVEDAQLPRGRSG